MTTQTVHLAHATAPRGVARHATTAARILLGAVFFVFGLNGFFHFIPQPKPPEGALAFIVALIQSGYLFALLKSTEVAVGALLLANRFVPLALTFIAPVIVNIAFFHAFLEPSGLPLALVLVALEVFLAWAYRGAFKPMLAAHSTPQSRGS